MDADQPLLQIKGLRTWLHTDQGVLRAVDGLSLNVMRQETLVLLGESACGKSMTALSILRLLPENGETVEGAIQFDGIDLLTLSESKMRTIRGKRIGMIFQEPGLCLDPLMPVGNQIEEVLVRHTSLRGRSAETRIVELLDAVGIPDPERRRTEYPHQLSGGIKQRVMIATALAGKPDLLIADEPTTALDVTIQSQVLDLLRDLQKNTHMSLLLITHDLGVASEMADRVAVMYAGEIVEVASRARFFSEPAHPYSRKLFSAVPNTTKRHQELPIIKGNVPLLTQEFPGCRFAERCNDAWDLCHTSIPEWTEIQPDHNVRCHLWEQGAKTDQPASSTPVSVDTESSDTLFAANDVSPLLKVNDLKVHFPIRKGLFKQIVGQIKAVDGLSLTIPSGRTLALVGESGCGKTTAAKAILRLISTNSGQVWFGGEDIMALDRTQMRNKRRDLQIIFQDPYASLNPDRQISDIITEGMRALGIGTSKIEHTQRVDDLLEAVGLSPTLKDRYPHEFSGGQRQRIAIARALSVNPKLIICDEPTSALDVSVQAQILNLLKELQSTMRITYLFITHNISVVEFLAHEIAVMYLGRIVEQGSVDEVLTDPRHPYTQALLSAVPVIDQENKREVIKLEGELPSPANPPSGCHFHPRCPEVMPQCREHYPQPTAFSETHSTFCHLYQKD